MSEQEKDEYMSNVKWKTSLYVWYASLGVAVAICGLYFGLKGGMADLSTQIRDDKKDVKHYVDSLQQINEYKFDKIFEKLDVPNAPTKYFVEKTNSKGKRSFEELKK